MAIRVISFGRKWEARPLCGAKCAGSLRPHYDYDWRDMFLIRLAAIVTYLALMLVFLSCLFIHHKGSVRDALHTPTPLSLSFCSVICVSTWAQIGWNSPYYPSRGVGVGVHYLCVFRVITRGVHSLGQRKAAGRFFRLFTPAVAPVGVTRVTYVPLVASTRGFKYAICPM